MASRVPMHAIYFTARDYRGLSNMQGSMCNVSVSSRSIMGFSSAQRSMITSDARAEKRVVSFIVVVKGEEVDRSGPKR